MTTIGDLLGDSIMKQVRDKGVVIPRKMNQAEYEQRVEATEKGLRLTKRLRGLQRDFSSQDFVRRLNDIDRRIGFLRKKKGTDWAEIDRLEGESRQIRKSPPFKRGTRALRQIRNQIDECKAIGYVDERRAEIDKRPNSVNFFHDLQQTIRKFMKQGHEAQHRRCKECDEVRKARRQLNFYEGRDVRIAVSL